MPKITTKTITNLFYQARKSARVVNPDFGSREGAAEISGINKTRLYRIETGKAIPHLDEVSHLSRIYRNPGLNRQFCATMCPLCPQWTLSDDFAGCVRKLKEGCDAMGEWLDRCA